jgi:hypothetical protein
MLDGANGGQDSDYGGSVSDYLNALWACLVGTTAPFLISALISVCVGLALAELESHSTSRLPLFLVYTHLLPLFIAPVLFCQVLVAVITDHHFPRLSQSSVLMAYLGYLFHVPFAYLVFSRVFCWHQRVNRVRQLTSNLRSAGARRGLYILELAPPVLFTVVMVFVFQESMVSAPWFVNRVTLVWLVRMFVGASTDMVQNSLLVAFVLVSMIFVLIVSYMLPKAVGLLLLRRAARLKKSGDKHVKESSSSVRTRRIAPLFMWLLAIFSATTIVVTCALVIVRLLREASHGSLWNGTVVVRTMLSDAVIAGIISLACFLLLALRGRDVRQTGAFNARDIFALLPPALLGTLGLLVTLGPNSRRPVAYGLLLVYAFLLVRFFVNDANLNAHRPLVHNAMRSGFKLSQKALILLASSLGAVLSQALFALYFLWIEDGIQTTILAKSSNLAKLVLGLRLNGIDPSIYVGMLISLVAWALVFGVVMWSTEYRFIIISKHLRKLALVAALMVSVLAHAEAKPVFGKGEQSCTYGAMNLSSNAVVNIGRPGCSVIALSELKVESLVARILVPATAKTVNINAIVLHRPGSMLYIGSDGTGVVSLVSITNVRSDNSTGTFPEIRFENIRIGRLSIGSGISDRSFPARLQGESAGVSLTMGDRAEVREVHLHEISSPAIALRMAYSRNDSIHIENVMASNIQIAPTDGPDLNSKVSDAARPATDIEVSAVLTEQDQKTPALSITGLDLLSLRIDISGSANRAIAELKDVHVQNRAVPSEIRFGGDRVQGSVRLEDVFLTGELDVRANRSAVLDTLLVSGLTAGDRPFKSSDFDVDASGLSRIVLRRIDVDNFKACEKTSGTGENYEIADTAIADDFVVPASFVNESVDGRLGRFEQSRFFRLLQEHGRYCGSNESIGLSALYLRKKAEIQSAHPFIAWWLDHLTGFGVRIGKAIWFFAIVVIAHFTLRLILLVVGESSQTRSLGTILSLCGKALAGMVLSLGNSPPTGWVAYSLEIMRVVFGWLIFFQVTLCSIYLSQTTLQ